jgi:hypothetical protein
MTGCVTLEETLPNMTILMRPTFTDLTLKSRIVVCLMLNPRTSLSQTGSSRKRIATRLRSGCTPCKLKWRRTLAVACAGGSMPLIAVTGTGGGTVEECVASADTHTLACFVVGGTPLIAVGAQPAEPPRGVVLMLHLALTALVAVTEPLTVAAITVMLVDTTLTLVSPRQRGAGTVHRVSTIRIRA